jgi:hypothetical protein
MPNLRTKFLIVPPRAADGPTPRTQFGPAEGGHHTPRAGRYAERTRPELRRRHIHHSPRDESRMKRRRPPGRARSRMTDPQSEPPKPLPASSSAPQENASAQPRAPPWWRFWRPASSETLLARATVWLVIATFLLAAIAAGQAWILATTDVSTRKAADAAVKSATTLETALQTGRENFRAEQRPIIWLTNNLGSPQYVNLTNNPGGGQIAWQWHFTNYGKSPALHLTFHQLIKIEDKIEEGYGYKGPSVGAPVPANKEDMAEIASQPDISAEQFKKLMAADEAIGVSGEITYYDTYGNKYITTFCLRHLTLGGSLYCKEGNDIK